MVSSHHNVDGIYLRRKLSFQDKVKRLFSHKVKHPVKLSGEDGMPQLRRSRNSSSCGSLSSITSASTPHEEEIRSRSHTVLTNYDSYPTSNPIFTRNLSEPSDCSSVCSPIESPIRLESNLIQSSRCINCDKHYRRPQSKYEEFCGLDCKSAYCLRTSNGLRYREDVNDSLILE